MVDFLVYNKYIKMNLPDMEIAVAEYAIANEVANEVPNSVVICIVSIHGLNDEKITS